MNVRHMTLCSLFAALMSLCAWISVPLGGVSFTLQTLGLFLTLGTLGGKLGFWTIFVYLLLGCAGLPVFSGFQGGLGILLGPTGGYLTGFLAAGLCYRGITALLGDSAKVRLAAMTAGQLVCYAFGSAWYFFLYGSSGITLIGILAQCVLPYLLPDGIKLALAWTLSNRLRRYAIQ